MEERENPSENMLDPVFQLSSDADLFYVFFRRLWPVGVYRVPLQSDAVLKKYGGFTPTEELDGTKAFLLNIVGNVVCFMPFGFILPIITRLGERWLNTLLLSFLLTLSIETIQLVFRVGSFDVDDMFLNTVGGAAGYVSVTMLKWIRRAFHGSKNEKDFIH